MALRWNLTRSGYRTTKAIDAVPIGGKGAKRCKVEVQEQKGDKDTVAVLEMHVNTDADVGTALISSLGNQHIWGVS